MADKNPNKALKKKKTSEKPAAKTAGSANSTKKAK